MALPGKTEMADERKPLDELMDALETARVSLKRLRKSRNVKDHRHLRRAVKAFRKLLEGTSAEADLLRKTWIAKVEDNEKGA